MIQREQTPSTARADFVIEREFLLLRYTFCIGPNHSDCARFGFAPSEVRLLKRHRHPHDRRSTGADSALARGGSRAPKSNR
jgi:hypothetical protein